MNAVIDQSDLYIMVGLQSKVMVYHFDTDENKTEIYQNINVSGSLYLCHSFDGAIRPGKGKSRRKRERYREAELKKNPDKRFEDERIGKVVSVDHTSNIHQEPITVVV